MAKLCWPEMRWYSENLLLTANYSGIYRLLTYCVPPKLAKKYTITFYYFSKVK